MVMRKEERECSVVHTLPLSQSQAKIIRLGFDSRVIVSNELSFLYEGESGISFSCISVLSFL